MGAKERQSAERASRDAPKAWRARATCLSKRLESLWSEWDRFQPHSFGLGAAGMSAAGRCIR